MLKNNFLISYQNKGSPTDNLKNMHICLINKNKKATTHDNRSDCIESLAKNHSNLFQNKKFKIKISVL